MHLNILPSMPGILFLKSMALLAITFFVPYWALFYHHGYESSVFASPWIVCVRKQCNFIKNIGQAEACRAALLISLLLSLPLGLSVPAQCFGMLSASLPEFMPFFTSLICLIIGSTELLAFIFFRLLLTQLSFLLREYSIWLNWPVYALLFSSVIYYVVGFFIFHRQLHLSTSLIQPCKKQSPPLNSVLSPISPDSKATQQPETKTSKSRGALEFFWLPKPTKAPLLSKLSESASKPQNFRASFSQMSNRSWISEQPLVSPNPKTSSYLFMAQSFFISPPNQDFSNSSSSKHTDL